jgi:hypothetical protein
MAGLAALAIGGAATSANAMQSGTFQNRLNGATIGLPLGAAPPPGLYSGLETAYLGLAGQNGGRGNQANGLSLPAIANAVPFLYVPGWNWWGATYSFGVVQAFYMGTVLNNPGNLNTPATGLLGFPVSGPGSLPNAGWYEVLANTFWSPINLSWNLGGGWFFSASFNVTGPDGSRWIGTPNPDYWTFEPAWAISYLGPFSTASLNFFYDINTQSNGPCCSGAGLAGGKPVTSGNALYIDGYWAWKIGKWQLGPVAYTEIQTTSDTGPGCSPVGVPAGSFCGRLTTVDVGALVGYDFGPVSVQTWFTQSVYRQNAIDGLTFWSRLGFRLWAPEAPHPLVAKN